MGNLSSHDNNEEITSNTNVSNQTTPCHTVSTKGPARMTHQQQMDGFLYTLFILMFYALTMLYFMLRQICRQERRNREAFYRLRFVTSNYAVAREERIHRSQMKKQLCVHLIKMGQLTQTFVTTPVKKDACIDFQQLPLIKTTHDGSPGDSESSPECRKPDLPVFGQKYQQQNVPRKITCDRGTITDDIFTTIIDIESDTSDVSV